MLTGLRQLLEEGVVLLELKALRSDLQQLTSGVARIAAALEQQVAAIHAAAPPPLRPASPEDPAFAVSYVNDGEAAEMMDIELRLTAATGQPPTEEEIIREWDRRVAQDHQTAGGSTAGGSM